MHIHKTNVSTLVFLAILFAFISCGESEQADPGIFQSCSEYGEPLYIGKLQDDRLSELSGMAFSRKNNGIFYVHNDAGHSAIIYVVNTKREILGTLVFNDVSVEDWEDIAVAKCGDDDCIFIADTGDNKKERDEIRIIRFVEPSIDFETPFYSMLITDAESMSLKYLDKPHDVEAMAVDDMGIYLFSKQLGYSAYFKTDEFSTKSSQTLAYMGRIDINEDESVTAADMHPDGLHVLLRTNDNIYEYIFTESSDIESLTALSYRTIGAGSEEQGEAAAYNAITGSIWHTSEAVSDEYPAIYEIRCK